jgi:hypothetical protein
MQLQAMTGTPTRIEVLLNTETQRGARAGGRSNLSAIAVGCIVFALVFGSALLAMLVAVQNGQGPFGQNVFGGHALRMHRPRSLRLCSRRSKRRVADILLGFGEPEEGGGKR